MIIKYSNNGCWGFVDGLNNVVKEWMGKQYAIEQYEISCKESDIDISNSQDYSKISSFVDLHLYDRFPYESYKVLHLLDGEHKCRNKDTVFVIVAENKYSVDYDKTVLVTDQEVFLMSDEGKTIERLV